MPVVLRYGRPLVDRDIVQVYTDFTQDQSDVDWVDTNADSGTCAVNDAADGILTMSGANAADNDEVYIASTNEVFLFATGIPHYCEALLQYSEAATNAANVAFGFCNAVGANTIVDNGAGPKSSFSGAILYKVDGGTVWRFKSSIGTTATDSISTTTAGGSAYQFLSIDIADVGLANTMTLQPKVNGRALYDATTGAVIRHNLSVASCTEMQVFAGMKNGTTSAETVLVDWIYAAKKRATYAL